MTKKAVVLYSGGLDSTTCLALAKAAGFVPYALSFAYGQRHAVELAKARDYAPRIGAVEHLVIEFDYRLVGGSALTADIAVPKAGVGSDIPVTYVPARNTVFLSFALGWAEALGAFDICIGVNALDYSGYPDCRPEYIAAFETHGQPGHQGGSGGGRSLSHPRPADPPEQGGDHPPGAGAGGRLPPHPLLLRPDPGGAGLRAVRLLPAAAEGVCGSGAAGSDRVCSRASGRNEPGFPALSALRALSAFAVACAPKGVPLAAEILQ